ncbi:Uma2 family endonuclease [Streptomyces sp. ISL-100]|uniref:Uma2 family endonuclease n=1 Tax=Streptomyces sp. ISL-100 TaxID=2819173 RepID=UPI001BE722F2|nr:Uma2 family endonuclease [Streptomyces sp. ISL-100]MBT2398720.1 Uma2 family endonuclease [Streptomyces sp. ISL-100]
MNPEHFALLQEARRAFPEGFKVEISGDTLIAQASPSIQHQRNLFHVRRQFDAHRPEGYMPTENSDLASPRIGKVRNPDLTYVPDDTADLPEHDIPAEVALIAVEIVSPSNPENDWAAKLRDYPVMGIPLYLIIDARESTVTLFSDANHDKYHTRTDRKFGETIHIPEPFDFDLDLGRLNPY